MGFLPLPDPHGIFSAPEIIFVPGFGQPGFLAGLFPGLLAGGLGTKTLPGPMPVIRKKKFVAVKAFTAPILSLHRVQKSKAGLWKKSEQSGKKIQGEEKSEPRRRKNTFQRITGKKSTGRRSISQSLNLLQFHLNSHTKCVYLAKKFLESDKMVVLWTCLNFVSVACEIKASMSGV